MSLFRRCLFCDRSFPRGRLLEGHRHGYRIAYDPSQNRLWTICDGCARWNLIPFEDRGHHVDMLEKTARDRGKPVERTANISLIDVGQHQLIRIGNAKLLENAWWRYGRELRKRQADYLSPGRRLAGYAFGAVAMVTDGLGIADLSVGAGWGDAPLADILRYRHFGWAAWYGREDCQFCGSTLTALRFDLSWWTFLVPSDRGFALGVPCPRCDPWTPEKVFRLDGDVADRVLRRVLAYQHISGASESMIRDAAGAIEAAGSPQAFRDHLAEERMTLWRLGRERSVALEIAVNESFEKRLLSLEASALEFAWRREEALARIVDDELTPNPALEELRARQLGGGHALEPVDED